MSRRILPWLGWNVLSVYTYIQEWYNSFMKLYNEEASINNILFYDNNNAYIGNTTNEIPLKAERMEIRFNIFNKPFRSVFPIRHSLVSATLGRKTDHEDNVDITKHIRKYGSQANYIPISWMLSKYDLKKKYMRELFSDGNIRIRSAENNHYEWKGTLLMQSFILEE